MSKKGKEIVETETIEEVSDTKVKESPEKQALRAYFDAYKIKNPVKYEMKKEAFQKQLDAMK